MEAVSGELEAGQRALEEARWTAARRSFEAVLDSGESAQAREGLGLALWFLGEVTDAVASRSCAFELYDREGRRDDAARMAVWVSHQHFVAGQASAARGWLSRAERVLQDAAEGEGHGWVAVERARHANRPEDRAAHALRAVAIAREVHASDLEVFALSLVGRARVEAGQTEAGLLLLEEALAGAVGGRVRNVHTLAEAYCNLIMASTSAGDWGRATEWCEHVDAFARSHETAPLLGTCRGVHAEVLIARGHWLEAERALETSLATHASHVPELAEPSLAALAELRVKQGRLAQARALLVGREESASALRALALLRMAEGRPDVAVVLLERGMRHVPSSVAARSLLLAALTEGRLAVQDVDGAREAVGELSELATSTSIRLVAARAELAAARVARIEGHVVETAEHAGLALRDFLGLAMPLEAAEARLELAHALVGHAAEVAQDEAQTALGVFRRLGATPYADAAVAFLREAGLRPTAAGPCGAGPLTPREQQVLELVARGWSNARIAASLAITEKTAGHHVSHILTKLGVRNRTEAAAHVRDQR